MLVHIFGEAQNNVTILEGDNLHLGCFRAISITRETYSIENILTSSSEISTPPGYDHADLPEQQHVREREVLDAQLVHDLPSVRVGAAFVTEKWYDPLH